MKYSFENKNPLWHVHDRLVPRFNQIVVGDRIVDVFPDNDGRVWYWDENGKKVVVE